MSLSYAANLCVLFIELPRLERPAAAKHAGFDAVELWWPIAVAVPTDAEVDGFVAAVTDSGVPRMFTIAGGMTEMLRNLIGREVLSEDRHQ